MNDLPLVDYIDKVIHNPVANMRETLRYLRKGLDGRFDVVDPTNPFMFLMEASVQHSAASVIASENELRKSFPIIANTPSDLYHHLTDKDYLGLFALPATAKISLTFLESEIRGKMVMDAVNGYKKLVIPANTTVEVGGYTFSLPYPIEIRELMHGHIAVVYDGSKPTPIHTLTTNIIEPYYSVTPESRFITITPTFLQYSVISALETITASTALNIERTIEDEFFFVRVYMKDSNNAWRELSITHSDYYYDPEVPTAMVKVLGKTVRVSIPFHYILTGMIAGQIRADIYQTKGSMNVDLGSFNESEFSTKFAPLDRAERTRYSEVVKLLSTTKVFSNNLVTGGRLPLPFQEQRRRVIYNTTGMRSQPITPDDIETDLSDLGYNVTKRVDVVTNRVFLASRTLPPPRHDKLITSASLSMQTTVFNAENALASGTVIDNGTSFTIDPRTNFRSKNALVTFVKQSEIDGILELPIDQRALALNRDSLFYTPFHYVVDMVDPTDVDVRPYYLTNPQALNKAYLDENSKTMMTCSVAAYGLEYVDGGYELTISTTSNEFFRSMDDQNVYAQLAFTPTDYSSRVYLNGEVLGRVDNNEYLIRFKLNSDFYLDKSGRIRFKNFTVSSATARDFFSLLEQDFEIFFSVSTIMGGQWEPAAIDNKIGKHSLPSRIAGVSQEKIKLKFGDDLKTLWAQSRVIGGSEEYERHSVDVPSTYPENVLEVKTVNGEAQVTIKHKKGDPRLDDQGEIIYLHRKGDIRTNAGVPVVKNPRKLNHQIDILMIESAYRFSNDEIAQDYKDEVAQLLAKWITEDLNEIKPNLLEETRIFFYPETRTGLVPVIFDNATRTDISASQTLVVNLYVDRAVETNIALRQQLREKGIREINNYFSNKVIGRGELVELLRGIYKDEVIEVGVSGLGGGRNNFTVLTLVEQTDRLSIGKKLTSRPDGKLLVEEDITFNFIRHIPKEETRL